MKATEANFLDFLKKSPQFVIPIYQRTYSWSERECRQLWDDIVRTGSNDAISAHFLGSIVYIEKGVYQISSQSPLLVIDGQQRLTTVTLILEALARQLGESEPVDGFSAKKLRSYYLLNPLEEGERGFKLLLTQTDKASLLALVQQKAQSTDQSLRITENFAFFEEQVKKLGSDLPALCHGIAKLVVVDIALSRQQDNPQLIFESMNSTGRALSQADLIRNFILMGLEPAHQTQLYEDHWRPMEVGFGQEGYGPQFDSFMRHYLTLKTGEIPNVRAVYEAFKAHARTPGIAAAGVSALVEDIRTFAGYYCAMALGKETDKKLAEAFRDLRELKVDVAYPFLLELYADLSTGKLESADFEAAVRLVEAYVFRRAVCAIPTNSLNKTFATFGRALRKDRYLESVRAHLLTLPSYRRFPGDEEFKRELVVRDLYNFPRRSYWLRRLENHGRKERVPVDEYTIEHFFHKTRICPRSGGPSSVPSGIAFRRAGYTRSAISPLTGYNPELSDRPFPAKRDMQGGFRESPLKLNEGLRGLDKWDEAAIKNRAERLAAVATDVWEVPSLQAEVLELYRTHDEKAADYTIDDHPQLAIGSPMRDLFEIFRKDVLALDRCISEEFLKVYVAYKAETNFVDIVPQKRRLILSLNMQFHELHDPKGLAKDVASLGRWGNGDVEVGLRKPEELPYVMGLVRQALEKQLGNGEVEP